MLFHGALKRSFPRINAGAPTTSLDKSEPTVPTADNLRLSPSLGNGC